MNIKSENDDSSVGEGSSSLQTWDRKAVVKVENESPREEPFLGAGNLADLFESKKRPINEIKTETVDVNSIENSSSADRMLSCASSSFAGESNILIKKEEDIDTDDEVFQAIIESNYRHALEDENPSMCDETNQPTTSYDEANCSNLHRQNGKEGRITTPIVVEDKQICKSQRSRAYYYSNGFKLAHVSVTLKDLKYYPITNIVEKQFTCAYCSAKFEHKGNLMAHVKIHTHNSSLKIHMTSHTGKKPFMCTVCPAKFGQSSHLKRHLTTHTGEKPFFCTICPAKFNQRCSLKKHQTTHTGEKPFLCTMCPAKFAQSDTLKRHLMTHTGEKPFSCAMCPAKFSQRSNLKTHLTTHTGEKPFSCIMCPAKFSQRSNLKKHLTTHTGEKQFLCKLCPAKFADSSSLKNHLTTHTGNKPFSCTICSAKFGQRGRWKRHLATHTNEKCFSCAHCSAKFNRKNDLKRHMADHP